MLKMHVVVVALGAVGGVAFGQVGFVSQARSILASATAGGNSQQSLAAPDFGLFDESVTASRSVPQGAIGFATARQRSQFLVQVAPTPIVTADISGFAQGWGSGGGGGSANSNTQLVFTLGRDTNWDLRSAYFNGDFLGGYINTVTLERLTPNPAVLADHSDFGVVNRFSQGTAPAGTYRFIANFLAFGGPQGTTVNFDIDLRLFDVPSPATFATGLIGGGVLLTRCRRA